MHSCQASFPQKNYFRFIHSMLVSMARCFFIAGNYCVVRIYHNVFIQSLVERYLSSFQFPGLNLGSCNEPTCEHMLLFLLDKYLGVEWLDHMVGVCFMF